MPRIQIRKIDKPFFQNSKLFTQKKIVSSFINEIIDFHIIKNKLQKNI